MKIRAKNHIIEIISEFEIVYQRLKHFPITSEKTNNKILINKNLIDIIIDNYHFEIEENIKTTDIYPIINNIISYCINDSDNVYIHSVVLSKNNKGYLLLGDFGSGKTTFADMLLKLGYKINSSDQTWLNKTNMVLGSCFNKNNDKIDFIKEEDYRQNVEIEKILILKPSIDNKLKIDKIENKNYYIKNLFKYCNWHYDMPLMTKYIKLIDTGEKILKYLNELSIDLYVVRGNGYEIMEALNGRKESFK